VIQLTVQSDVYVIILITIILAAAIILLSKKFDQADPLEKPKGILVPILWAVQTVYGTVKDNVGENYAKRLTPYVLVLWVYIFVSNIISLFGFSSPTANLSVTLLLAFLTWLMIQAVELKYQGIGGYLHGFLEPIPVMLPMNIFGKFSTMVSMSLRLFGNILCGGIMMQLIYSFCQFISNKLVGLVVGSNIQAFNFVAPILAPLLHAYFDLFAGFIQTLVFVTLTIVLIGNDIPEDVKKA
jgi:F-type H+-transporting ATPase subunit a